MARYQPSVGRSRGRPGHVAGTGIADARPAVGGRERPGAVRAAAQRTGAARRRVPVGRPDAVGARAADRALAGRAAPLAAAAWPAGSGRCVGRAARETHHLRDELLRSTGEAAAQAERNRLARDLHDSIKQQLYAINVSAAARWPVGRPI
ncbi:MAG: hypothetical protein HZY76_11025 [Anaerolineae bacterium]|nr:MAG: hypothetical protein HZY76_11025 [Anaerolineae bacterium]